MVDINPDYWSELRESCKGEIHLDELHKSLYATDASIYRKIPLGVVYPKDEEDVITIVKFCKKYNIPIIPRTAGTSLAGQCVGEGLIVDVSKYMNNILEINEEEGWVRVQPGVVRDELNAYLQSYGLHFGPNTSTANRCMIGGMVGNNSCGSSSIVYGSTRDHTLELKTVLSDGSTHTFRHITEKQFQKDLHREDLVGHIYKTIHDVLSDEENIKEINRQYPKPHIQRRNTGYALDLLGRSEIYGGTYEGINMCQLLCGSEGTLALTTEIKLHVNPLPPEHHRLICAHFHTISESMKATVTAMKHKPYACELMDKIILDCTKSHHEYVKYRWWVEGDPEGVLMVEVRHENEQTLDSLVQELVADLKAQTEGYAYPILSDKESSKAWQLRKGGLGLLANIGGNGKAVACIEDTAVAIEDLPAFIAEFEENMVKYNQRPVYYAHAGDGEIHLRPVLDLSKEQGRKDLYDITKDTALLVKKYGGSLSGEHGDGRVRAPFIPLVLGKKVYSLLQRIKYTWDPDNIFNPGKIVDTDPIDIDLREELTSNHDKSIETAFDFGKQGGLISAVEQCNGSGDCRKLPVSGGVMCPSYHATRNEIDTTRGRANALREFLQKHPSDLSFSHPELAKVMDLCISCKGCTSECPSNVDMSKIKAEYQHQLHKEKGIPFSIKLIAENYTLLKTASSIAPISNFFFKNGFTSKLVKRVVNMSPHRDIPMLSGVSLKKWFLQNRAKYEPDKPIKTIFLFCDEFTDLLDTNIGKITLKLLWKLRYRIEIPSHQESGRAHISKGVLDRAKTFANFNVTKLSKVINSNAPLIGIEPSAILTFRDEYIGLVDKNLQADAEALASHCLLLEEFLLEEIKNGNIKESSFDTQKRTIKVHGHCHQKALSSDGITAQVLAFPQNHIVEIIRSGCCGMAGSFGYDKDHYEVSMTIGELVLFPSIKNSNEETIIAAPGTSCRHQIKDGTSREALHPAEVLYQALV